MTEHHSLFCVRCHDPVDLTEAEYEQKLREQWKRAHGYKAKTLHLLCPACAEAKPKKIDAHPLAGTRRKNVTPRVNVMPKAKTMSLRPDERPYYGIIVTLREQTTMELRTIVENGAPTEALKAACVRIDMMEGDWKIVCTCTPASIYRDLQGDYDPKQPWPEAARLSAIGREDLVEPRRKIYIGER